MSKLKKPAAPKTPFPDKSGELHREGDWLWIPLRNEWRDVTTKPEEIVRQNFVRHLIDHYGYALNHMDQERRTMHGHRSPRADVVLWETPEKKAANATPVLVVECKTEQTSELKSARNHVKSKRAEASAKRRAAWNAFEAALFEGEL